MRYRIGLCLAALLLVGGLPSAAGAQAPLKIGFFGPLTGSVAADGASARHAVELAAQEVNGPGGLLGKPVELVVYDDRLNPQEAVAIAHKLIEKDRVVARSTWPSSSIRGRSSFTWACREVCASSTKT